MTNISIGSLPQEQPEQPSSSTTGTRSTGSSSSSSIIIIDVARHVLINVVILSILLLSICLASLPLCPASILHGSGPSSTYSFVRSSAKWSFAQIVKSISTSTFADGVLWAAADAWEASAWGEWERIGRPREQPQIMEVPTVDLRSCGNEEACATGNGSGARSKLSLSDVKALVGDDFVSKPLLLRGLWSEKELADPKRRLSIRGMQSHDAELANLSVPFYADASKSGYAALKPSGVAKLSEIVYNITELRGKQKIGSQLLVETYPALIKEVAPSDIVTELFGSHFEIESVKGSGPFGLLPATTTVPVFLAGSKISEQDVDTTSRTDLHCEPIGNVAVQLHGSKLWTLIEPRQSTLLKPSVSRHGRAFYYSNINPLDPNALANVRHYKVITRAGDGLWVPPWMWHRVDYLSDVIGGDGDQAEPALAASLFHFRPAEFAMNNPLFALLMIPNLFKELLGRNTE